MAGVASSLHETAPPTDHISDAWATLRDDGVYEIAVGTVEFGEGTSSAHVQIAATQLGTTPSRLARLSVVPGLDRRTLARWRAWWRPTFSDGPFAAVARAAVATPINIAALPVSLLDRFAGDMHEQLIALLRFLGPLTGGASAMRAF